MAAGLELLVAFWIERGIHITVVLSFIVQLTLLLLADIRRRVDWPVLKVIIWSAYMLADTTAVYALGHLSVVVRSPEHRLMALWAPLLLVHLGGQDNITAYSIEDNRLWLRHLQTFGVQLLAAGYVLYASSILFLPSLLRSAAILMYVVGVLKYGERIWALMAADSCANSSQSATSYKDVGAEQEHEVSSTISAIIKRDLPQDISVLVAAYSLLDVAKQMFEGPTSFMEIENMVNYEIEFMLKVVEMQLTMMYDLLYTKAAVVHTWYGFFVRVISLPFTVAALQLFHTLSDKDGYGRVDVVVTKVLLTGAVVLETMSVLRAVFSMWTAALLYERKWYMFGYVVHLVEKLFVVRPMMLLVRTEGYWSGHMRQHDLFQVFHHTGYSRGSRIAKRMGREDLWDSTFYSWSIRVPDVIFSKVLELMTEDTHIAIGEINDTYSLRSELLVTEMDVSRPILVLDTSISETSNSERREYIGIGESRGRNALMRADCKEELAWSVELDLDESILVWHIATHVYLLWYIRNVLRPTNSPQGRIVDATVALCNYMFFLLVARPHMLPYPVSRKRYVKLCHDSISHVRGCTVLDLLTAILEQKEAVYRKEASVRCIIDVSPNRGNALLSINSTLDKGCLLAAMLLDIAGRDTTSTDFVETIFEVWVEMLCYTAYCCNAKNKNEKFHAKNRNEISHAKNLTNGGELMTIVSFMMVYISNGIIDQQKRDVYSDTSSP